MEKIDCRVGLFFRERSSKLVSRLNAGRKTLLPQQTSSPISEKRIASLQFESACHANCLPDNSWIKSYGKGRVFNCSMGHTSTFFQTPELGAFLLSAIQFVLGDLPADTTPSAKLAAKKTPAK